MQGKAVEAGSAQQHMAGEIEVVDVVQVGVEPQTWVS